MSSSEDEQLADDGFELLSIADESSNEASDSEIITREIQNSEETVIFYHKKVLENCSKNTVLRKKRRVSILRNSERTSTEYSHENQVEPVTKSRKKITPRRVVKNYSTNKNVEDELFTWILRNQNMNNPVTYLNIRQKVQMLNKELNGPSHFVPNRQWFRIFTTKYKLIEKPVNQERSTVDFLKPIKYAKAFKDFIIKSGYDLDRVYSTHKTCMCWNPLPHITLDTDVKHENVCQHKVTLLICSNFSGNHKIPILVIGKSDDTNFLNDMQQLSVIYKREPNSTDITEKMFIDWYQSLFLPALKEKYNKGKFLLLLNDTPTSSSEIYLNQLDEMCQVQYLPLDFSSKIQPVQQRITLFIKRYFKKYVIREVLLFHKKISNFCMSWSLLHALKGISTAWDSIRTIVLYSMWSELLQEDSKFEYNLICSALNEMSSYIYKGMGFHDWTEDEMRKWLEDDLPDSCRNEETKGKLGKYETNKPSDELSLLKSEEINIISSDEEEEILIYN